MPAHLDNSRTVRQMLARLGTRLVRETPLRLAEYQTHGARSADGGRFSYGGFRSVANTPSSTVTPRDGDARSR